VAQVRGDVGRASQILVKPEPAEMVEVAPPPEQKSMQKRSPSLGMVNEEPDEVACDERASHLNG
jgi:hypothetical protein